MTTESRLHIPVMCKEMMHGLNIQENGVYLDATFGRGGHSRALLAELGPEGRLIVLDRDPRAISSAKALAAKDRRVVVHHLPFGEVGRILHASYQDVTLDGAMLDLGVSSPQLDEGARGFSFSQDAPLDMRMDPETGVSARQWLARASQTEIQFVLNAYGEEAYAAHYAQKIADARELAPINTTKELADIVIAAAPNWRRTHHPATLVFQAIRIHVNDEHGQLRAGVMAIALQLKKKGRLGILSYHSLEDRWVSQAVKEANEKIVFGLSSDSVRKPLRKVGNAQKTPHVERMQNPRSRSALLRIWEKLC